jgi:outer membrane lipoprotein
MWWQASRIIFKRGHWSGHRLSAFLGGLFLLLSACAESAHQSGLAAFDKLVAAELRDQVDRSIDFPEVRADPEKYQGRVLLLGGLVLNAKRFQNETELEVLQVRLNKALAPVPDRAQSQGRFLAIRREFLDPATLRSGTPVTVVGQVIGATVRSVDETPYTYPILEIKQLTVWESGGGPYGYRYAPYYGGYYGGYWDPFGGPYGPYYPYPYLFRVPVVPLPPPPPPEQVPPQFKKR